MTESTNSAKQTAKAFYESYNAKDLDTSFATYVSPALINHAMGGIAVAAGWRDMDKTLFPAFADFSFTVLDQVAEGNKVATRWSLGGTQTGELMGIPAKGNVAFLLGTSIDRVENGKIVEHWSDLDFSGFVQKLTA